jgi:EAL domain-containing protein (putative c-di-GMP-specific phosphodiesterase class I)
MSADGQRVTGLEALLRWNHVQHGAISPQVFVSLAEQNDLMTELGDWVLRQAMQDVRLWPDLVTSINLSAAQFARPDFADKVIELARAMGVSTAMIEFEITETALSNDMASFTDQVRKLSQAGFQFALDDFGSGYASIGYLSKLQFDKLKIDRSFVSELGAQPNADRLIRSMVSLGDAMGLTVTAEGVEEVFQHEMLKSAGCNQMQGYLFYKPCSREEIQMILSQQPTAACVA